MTFSNPAANRQRPAARPHLLGLALPLILALPAWAQSTESPDAATPLDDIVVHTSALKHSADQITQPVQLLSGEALEQRRSTTLGETLDGLPGISNASFGAGVGRPVIRGQSGTRVQMLENGQAVADASALSADHAVASDPLLAEQIEIIKGPATLIYGGGASAGVVNVIDDRLPDRLRPGLTLSGAGRYNSNGDGRSTALKARYGSGHWQWGAQGTYQQAGDTEIPVPAHRHGDATAHDDPAPGTLDNSHLRQHSQGASLAWINDRGMLGVALSQRHHNYGIPSGEEPDGAHHDHDDGDALDHDDHEHSHDGARIDLHQKRIDARGLLFDPLPGFDRLEARLSHSQYHHEELEPDGDIGTRFEVKELDSRIELAHAPLGDWVGVIGTQWQHRDFRADGDEAFVPPTLTRNLGLFAVESLALGAHRLELGARVDRVTHDTERSNTARADFTPTSLSAGLNAQLAPHLHLRLTAQRAQRAPAAQELFAYGEHGATQTFERGDDSLKLETAQTLDLSLSHDHGRWQWQIGGFYNRINDYLLLREVDQGLNADGSGIPAADGIADRVDDAGQFSPNGALLLLDIHQQDARLYGFEATTRLHLWQRNGWTVEAHGFADSVRGRTEDTHESLPRLTPVRIGGGVDARYQRWSGALRYTRALRQTHTAALETPTPGYGLLATDLGYTLSHGATQTTLYLQGRNLLDDEQRLSTSVLKDVAPQPGRSILVGVRVDFGE